MKKRSNLEIMAKLIGMVRPLLGYMLLAITLGLIGHLLASFITIFAGYAALKVWGFSIAHSFAFLHGGLCHRQRICPLYGAVLQPLHCIQTLSTDPRKSICSPAQALPGKT